ncbi:MAG: hypothetical protein ACRDRP_02165 [Pseudonocardiaceae bacterium]
MVLAALAIAACVACGNQDAITVTGSQARPSGSPTDTTSPTGNGISADEAKARGVFAADYDARFEDQRSTSNSGKSMLVLTNIGNKEDTYTITVNPPEASSVSPDTTTVASGRSTQLTVQHNGQVEVKVRSHGRGTEIASRILR